ncbi:MAG: hypothetical protein RMK31_09010, partial [Candidatus Caldarchaeum sp.]|nr:hypothetical protein [Candidatus Caldarchaeum sp.]
MSGKPLTPTTVGAIVAALVIGLVAGAFVGPTITGPSQVTVVRTTTVMQGAPGAQTVTATATATVRLTTTVTAQATPTRVELAGKIEIDGSSTVYPITEAVAEAFM